MDDATGQYLDSGGRTPRHGRPAAVLMAADDLESLHETLFGLSQPGIREDIAAAEREVKAGETTGADELRAEFRLTE